MIPILFKSELSRNFTKKIYIVLFIVIAVTFLIIINTLITAYQLAAEKPFQNLDVNLIVKKSNENIKKRNIITNMHETRLPFSSTSFETNEIEYIKNLSDVKEISKSLLIWDMTGGKFTTVMGIDFHGPEIGINKIKDWVVYGKLPIRKNEILLEKHFAKFLNLREGDIFNISGRKFIISGRVEIKKGNQLAAANAFMHLNAAQELISKSDIINIIYLKLNSNDKINYVKEKITKSFSDISVFSSDSVLETSASMIKIADKFSLIISVVGAVFTFLIIVKIMLISIGDRIRDVGILKAIGWSNKEVKKELMIETIFIISLSAAIGILFSILLAFLISKISISTVILEQNPPASSMQFSGDTQGASLPFILMPYFYLTTFTGSVLTGILCGHIITKRVLKIKPFEVLRKI